jgi:dihydroorotase
VTIIDASGLLVAPGLIDMHAHLREPGDEEEETIRSGARAAVAGGITSVAAFPNTEPAIDNEASAEFVVLQGKRAGFANVFPVGAVTLGRAGEELSEMAGLTRAGAVAFSDADRCLRSAEIMRRGLLYAKMFDRPVVAFCEDADLRSGGVMNYGRTSLRLGLPGIPDISESIVVARDIELAQISLGRLHIGQLSAAGSVGLVRRAKEDGLSVTAEVTPHHFSLTEESCTEFDPNYKILPPLRAQHDIDALVEGLRDGTIDVIASGHAPHSAQEKAVEFVYAPFGVVGLETMFGVAYSTLVEKHGLPLIDVLAKMTINPARLLGLAGDRGQLSPGKLADISVFDLSRERLVDPSSFESKGRNTCFAGARLRGSTAHVFVGGRHVVENGRVLLTRG